MDKDKIMRGQEKVKKLEAGTHTNLQKLRKVCNSICEQLEIEKPSELNELNELFEN